MMADFTLVLDREPNDDEQDALYEAGLSDAQLEYGAGQSFAHVDREADSLAEAIVIAVRQVESVGLKAVAVRSDDLVSLKDIAARVKRTYESVRLLATGARGPGGFPPPMSGSGWSLYSWSQVVDWFDQFSGPVDTVGARAYDREIAAADHLVRARAMLPDGDEGATLAGFCVRERSTLHPRSAGVAESGCRSIVG